MTPISPVPVQPVLRGCLHLLVLALLALAAARAVGEDAPHAGAVLATDVAVLRLHNDRYTMSMVR